MSRNRVSKDFAEVWFALHFEDDAPPPVVGQWHLVRVTDYLVQRRQWDAWYQADVDGKPWALAGRVTPRVSLARIPGGYHVKCDDKYINVTPDMVGEAVFVLCADALEGDE